MTKKKDFRGILAFCILLLTACMLVAIFLPADADSATDFEQQPIVQKENTSTDNITAEDSADSDALTVSYKTAVTNYASSKNDIGLMLYRSVESRAAVEWFYTHITENAEVARAILEQADQNDIPLPLAFALAYTESGYKTTAINRNTNASIDRGLFQLNNNSFPYLTEEEFFDPAVSAKYGMSHLRFCIDTAGNEVAALAMYNAGTNKVRTNRTPQMTLNYVSKIMNYRIGLEELFNSEIASFYAGSDNSPILASGKDIVSPFI